MAHRSDCEDTIDCYCGALCPILFVISVFVCLFIFVFTPSPFFLIDLFNDQAFNVTKSRTNLTIQFDLKLENLNSGLGLYYPDPINITFSYFSNVYTMNYLAGYKLDSFYQGNGKTRHVRDVVVVGRDIFPTVLEGTDTIVFRVDLTTTYRFKEPGSKRQKVELGCIIEVNHTTGEKFRQGFIGLVKPGLDAELSPKPEYMDRY